MSSVTTDLWGQDIALDDSGQARVAANGELLLTDGVETGVQDIRLRLFTRQRADSGYRTCFCTSCIARRNKIQRFCID